MPRSYTSYKNKGIKLPIFAWLFERPIVFTIIMMLILTPMGLVITKGKESWESILSTPKVYNPYIDAQGAEANNVKWSKNFITTNPINVNNKWVTNKSLTPKPIEAKECYSFDLENGMQTNQVANDTKQKLVVQTYSAAQAIKAFESIKQNINNCYNTEVQVQDYNKSKIIDYPHGFIMTIGDVLIQFESTQSIEENKTHYYNQAVKTLIDTQCKALEVNPKDSQRNIYLSENYKGLKEKTEIFSEVDVTNIKEAPSYTEKELPIYIHPEPEKPLPKNFINEPEQIEKPKAPKQPKVVKKVSKNATYEIEDTTGPGCGWEWTGTQSPDYSNAKLDEYKNKAIIDAQETVDEKAYKYLEKQNNWYARMQKFLIKLDEWNNYVDTMQKVSNERVALVNARASFKPTWDEYIRQYEQWVTFDTRKETAKEQYELELETCKAQTDKYTDWETDYQEIYDSQQKELEEYNKQIKTYKKDLKKYTKDKKAYDEQQEKIANSDKIENEEILPEPIPPTEPTDPAIDFQKIPTKPEPCTQEPTEPSILSEKKGKEPKAPKTPENMTIPNSWLTKEKINEQTKEP